MSTSFILGTNLLFMVAYLPSILLQFSPLDFYLPKTRVRLEQALLAVLLLYEYGLMSGLMINGYLPVHYGSYRDMAFLLWLPSLLLSLCFHYRQWSLLVFIALLHILFLVSIESVTLNLMLLFVPLEDYGRFYPINFLLYGLVSVSLYIPLKRYYIRVFRDYEQLGNHRFWRAANALPFFLVLDSLYVALHVSREELFLRLSSRLILTLVVLLYMAAIRRGLRQLCLEMEEQQKKEELENQVLSAYDYVKLAEQSKERLNEAMQQRQKFFEQVQRSLEQGAHGEVLALIDREDGQLTRTKLPRYCENALINATLTAYMARAREQGVEVTVQADIPEQLSLAGDLAMVLSNLMENAILAAAKEAPEERHLSILVLQRGTVLNLLVRNRYSGTVEFDQEGLPVTHKTGHGLGMRSLARFRDKYGASVLCQLADGQFSTYIQVETQLTA